MSRAPFRLALFTGNYNYTRDGATQALNRLVDHLQDEVGAQVRVYAPTTDDPAIEPNGEIVSIPSIGFPGRPEYRLGLGLNPSAREDFTAFAPDVVHLSTPDILGFQAQRLARQTGLPVVASLHTRFETYFNYYGLGWLEPLIQSRLKSFYRDCDYVLAPNRPMADELAQLGVPGRVRIWGRGVDRELFDPARRDPSWRRAMGFRDEDVVVLFFGRVVLEKGLALFADVIDRLRAAHPNVRALVVGDGPAQAWLKQRLPQARFTGFLTGPALARAVASADVMLNPSTTEAFGNVTLEALAAGLAVIAADVPASRFLISPGSNGLLCQPADPTAYAAAIEGLIVDPETRRRIAAAAREASARFSWSAAMEAVVEVYREAMAGEEDVAAA